VQKYAISAATLNIGTALLRRNACKK